MKSTSVDPPDLPQAINWRYRDAIRYANKGKHMLRSQGDALTRELYRIKKSRSAEPTSTPRCRDGNFDKDVLRALEIHESEQNVRAQLQALLLTELTFEQLANEIGEPLSVVETYAKCFFDIRNDMSEQQRLEVVAAYKSVPADRLWPEFFWKIVALFSGHETLNAILSPPKVQSIHDAVAASAAEAKTIALHKLAEAAKTIDPSDSKAIRDLRQLTENLDEVQPDEAHDYLLKQLDGVFKTLPLTVGTPDPATAHSELAKFDNSAVELNADEVQRVALGQTLENEDELLATTFPERPDSSASGSKAGFEESCAPYVPTSTDPKPESTPDEAFQIPCKPSPAPRVTSATTLQYALDRNEREMAAAEKKRQAREKAIQKVAENEARLSEEEPSLAAEARLERLDREWEDYSQGHSGRYLHKLWKAFRTLHPEYQRPDTRKLLAKFGKGRKRGSS